MLLLMLQYGLSSFIGSSFTWSLVHWPVQMLVAGEQVAHANTADASSSSSSKVAVQICNKCLRMKSMSSLQLRSRLQASLSSSPKSAY